MRGTGLIVVAAAGLSWLAMSRGAAADDGSAATAGSVAPPDLAAQLAALKAQVDDLQHSVDAQAASATADVIKEPTFRLYGFIDMGLQKLWVNDTRAPYPTSPTFVLGNINLYFDFHPSESWSSLVEARLTNAPNGIPADFGNGPGWNNLTYGAVVLQRAYIQWQKRDSFGVRVGQFLTPYGIWNVDHGSPTLIAISAPQFVTNEMWPARQIGVEAFGRFRQLLQTEWDLEYHAYVSNGRTTGDVDLSTNKTYGGRLQLSRTKRSHLAFGVSAITGDYVEAPTQTDAASGLPTEAGGVVYHEEGLAADASLDVGNWRVRAEVAMRQRDFKTDSREPSSIPGVYVADGNQFDVYALAAYRVPGTRFEPYGYFETYHFPTLVGDYLFMSSAGLNVYFTPAIQLKLQYSHQTWRDDEDVFSMRGHHFQTDFAAAKLVMGF